MTNVMVSIIIPCRNEKKFILPCLESIAKNDYPNDMLEVFVVDGMSEDGTRELLERAKETYSWLHTIDNSKRIAATAMNIGIAQAKGDLIMRMDAHSTYDSSYVRLCVEYSQKYGADNVGGRWVTLPRSNTLIGKAIALASSHPIGSGNALYRTGYTGEPRWVDTVPYGCYKREVFEKIGLFDERLVRSQDMEFNLRLRKAGGKILLVPEISSSYYIRSTFLSFFMHNVKDGIWSLYPLKFVKFPLRPRHYAPLVFIFTLMVLVACSFIFPMAWIALSVFLGLYIGVILGASVQIARSEKNWKYVGIAPIAFVVRHFGYGIGSVWGVIRIFI